MRSKKLRPKPVTPAPVASDTASVQPRSAAGLASTSGHATDATVPDEPSEAELAGPATPPVKASGLTAMGSAIGGVIAGIENQVFGRPPPGPVLIRRVTPSGGTGPDGIEFTIDFPEDAPGPPPPSSTGSTRTGG